MQVNQITVNSGFVKAQKPNFKAKIQMTPEAIGLILGKSRIKTDNFDTTRFMDDFKTKFEKITAAIKDVVISCTITKRGKFSMEPSRKLTSQQQDTIPPAFAKARDYAIEQQRRQGKSYIDLENVAEASDFTLHT